MSILDWVFPKKCVGCGKLGSYFCVDCAIGARRAYFFCPVCGKFSPGGVAHDICKKKSPLDGLYVVWRNQGVVKKALNQHKYRFIRGLADELSKEGAMLILSDSRSEPFLNFLDTSPVWVGMPRSRSEQRKRGFNEADLIAERLNGELGGKLTDCIGVDNKDSGLANLVVRNFVAVSDIWSDHEEMETFGKELKRMGAGEVWGFALAR